MGAIESSELAVFWRRGFCKAMATIGEVQLVAEVFDALNYVASEHSAFACESGNDAASGAQLVFIG